MWIGGNLICYSEMDSSHAVPTAPPAPSSLPVPIDSKRQQQQRASPSPSPPLSPDPAFSPPLSPPLSALTIAAGSDDRKSRLTPPATGTTGGTGTGSSSGDRGITPVASSLAGAFVSRKPALSSITVPPPLQPISAETFFKEIWPQIDVRDPGMSCADGRWTEKLYFEYIH